MDRRQHISNLFKKANFVIFLGFILRIFWSFSVQYREDEGVLLWLSLTKNVPEVIFSNLTSKGIPNPNLAIFFLKTLTHFRFNILKS